MTRPTINERAMTAVERRRKSDEDKRTRGEKRISTWIPKSGADALADILATCGGDEREVITDALLEKAKKLGLKPKARKAPSKPKLPKA